MKKVILVFVFLVSSVFSTKAQLVKFGAKAGLNYANFSGSTIQTSAITSYHAGVIAQIKIADPFAIQPELLYSTQGATYKTAVEDFKNELGYLSIPIIAKINLNDHFGVEIGPQASFLLSNKNNFDATKPETFDFSGVGGLFFKITDSFFVEGRYVLGLTEVSKEAKAKNAVVQLSVGLLF